MSDSTQQLSALIEQGQHMAMPGGAAFNPSWELTPRQVQKLLEDHPAKAIIIDVREPNELAAASIAGTTHVPMGEVQARIAELEDLAEDEQGEPIIVVTMCHGGVRSLNVAAFLRSQGIETVWSMAGGIDAWAVDIDQSIPRY